MGCASHISLGALTHWDRDNIAAISQTPFSNALYWIRNLCQRFELTIFQHIPDRRQAIIWASDDPFYWRIYASLGLNDLTRVVPRDCGKSRRCFLWRLLSQDHHQPKKTFVVRVVSMNNIAPLGSTTSADLVMTKFACRMYIRP